MPSVFFELLLAHLLGDFIFQSNDLLQRKYKSWTGTFEHVCIIAFFTIFFLFPYWNQSFTWITASVIFCTHFVQDVLKIGFDVRFNAKRKSVIPFFMDQLFHISLIAWLSTTFATLEPLALPEWIHKLYFSQFLALYCIGLVFFSYVVDITQYQFYRKKTANPREFKPDFKKMRQRILIFSIAYVLFLLVNGSFV